MKKWYKIHLKDEKDGLISYDCKLENFNDAITSAYEKIDTINERKSSAYRVIGIYEIMYDREQFNKLNQN